MRRSSEGNFKVFVRGSDLIRLGFSKSLAIFHGWLNGLNRLNILGMLALIISSAYN